jgi:hypothetical protein
MHILNHAKWDILVQLLGVFLVCTLTMHGLFSEKKFKLRFLVKILGCYSRCRARSSHAHARVSPHAGAEAALGLAVARI